MIITKNGAAAADVPARVGRDAGAAVAGRDGSRRCPRLAATAAAPVRVSGFVYIPMGIASGRWTPDRRGPDHRAVADRCSSLDAVSRSGHASSRTSSYKNAVLAGNHATANARFLSGVRARRPKAATTSSAPRSIRSRREQIGQDTRCPRSSWRPTSTTSVGNCDNGYACVYMNKLSWSTPTTPLPTEANPRVVFERMFGDGGTRPNAARSCGRTAASSTGSATNGHGCSGSSAPATARGSTSTSIRCARSNAASRRRRQQDADAAARSSSGRSACRSPGRTT